MGNLSTNLKRLLEKNRISEQELGRRTKINQSVIHRLISGENQNPTLASLKAIASYFMLTVSQLIGEDPIPTLAEGRYNKNHAGWRTVPLLDWNQAMRWKEYLQKYRNNQQEFRLIKTDVDVSADTFALEITGSSMEPRFEKGTIIIVDPHIGSEDKDFVVIQTHNTTAVVFKEMIKDGSDRYVRSLNPSLRGEATKLQKGDKIIATMVQALNYRERTSTTY